MAKRAARRAWQKLDPHFEREQDKYGNAIPSRELIVRHLKSRGRPATLEDLTAEWRLNPTEVDGLSRRLKAMAQEGELVRNRREGYGVPDKMDMLRGRVIGHPEGHGFLAPDEGGENLFISPREMRKLMHGDRIVARIAGVDRRGRREAALVEILERATKRVVGRFYRERGIGFVMPDNRRINQDIVVPPAGQRNAQPGQIVVAELVSQPTEYSQPIGEVVEILGEHMAPGMEVEIAIRSYDLPNEWSAEVEAEAERFATEVPEVAKEGRWDLRKLPLVTIDGIDARDFDDAVYCERRGGQWRLIVAIADVSWYVRPDTALDAEAERRGTSVYFPDRVLPMLPEALSNGLCSLKPRVDRLCLACEMTLNADGQILRSRFREALMHSAARLTYDTVAALLVGRNRALRAEYAELIPRLDDLYGLYEVLRAARERRGAIDFDTQETIIEYGPDRKIERIVPSERNDAHRLIEECMIAANVAAARFLRRHRIPALYRIHEGPSVDRLEKLRGFLGKMGLALGGGERPGAKDYAALLERVRERPDVHLLQTMLLRSLSQAVYSPDNAGHFGLALEAYAHFTSPIRRYPDLLVHRAIRHVLQGGKGKDFHYSHTHMVNLGEHASMTERRADEATHDAVAWLKCEFMLDKVARVFSGVVSGVTSFGLFVELKEVFVEGLLHVTALPNDYYHYDPASQLMRGERGGRVFRLGDSIRVKVMRVDLDERKIDFELAAERDGRKPRQR